MSDVKLTCFNCGENRIIEVPEDGRIGPAKYAGTDGYHADNYPEHVLLYDPDEPHNQKTLLECPTCGLAGPHDISAV